MSVEAAVLKSKRKAGREAPDVGTQGISNHQDCHLNARTPREARDILRKPIFGSERCIAARDLIRLSNEVRDYRAEFGSDCWDTGFNPYRDKPMRKWPRIEFMTEEKLRWERSQWAAYVSITEE
jgi:hypothetical protein